GARRVEEDEETPRGPASSNENAASERKIAHPASPNVPRGRDDAELWRRIKEEIREKKPVFDHYLEACRMVFLSSSKVQLIFSDPFTLDRAEQGENRKILLDAVKAVCGGGVDATLTCGAAGGAPEQTPHIDGGKKTASVYNKAKAGEEAEPKIIQDALHIFGGSVIGSMEKR
ncbi:MAG: hypothetical protein ACE5GQ_02625, partial [Nitrospinales bacterium]